MCEHELGLVYLNYACIKMHYIAMVIFCNCVQAPKPHNHHLTPAGTV